MEIALIILNAIVILLNLPFVLAIYIGLFKKFKNIKSIKKVGNK